MQQTLFALDDRFTAWQRFHTDNPAVFELFQRFATEAYYRGVRKLSARVIGERIRWYTSVETSDPGYKVNDHHWPYYARLLAGTDSRFAGFFEFRDKAFDASTEQIVRAHKATT